MFGLTMEAFHRFYGSRNPGIQLVRSLGMNHVQKNDHLKRIAMSIAACRIFLSARSRKKLIVGHNLH